LTANWPARSSSRPWVKTPVTFLSGRVVVKVGDITREPCSAIVNAANPSLYGGGGVDGAIHRAAGPALLAECRKIRQESYPEGLPPGQAVITGGGNLAASHVIHTVGPIWRGGHSGEPRTLADCYTNSLIVAADHKLDSVALSAISTGVYGFPRDIAAEISSKTVEDFCLNTSFPEALYLSFSPKTTCACF